MFDKTIYEHIASYLTFRELFQLFEPINKLTHEISNDYTRKVATLNLVNFQYMKDEEFVSLCRRCANLQHISIPEFMCMTRCHQNFWEIFAYCPKLSTIFICGSPFSAHEFVDEVVFRLAMVNGSIPGLYMDDHKITAAHMYCCARLVYLVKWFKLENTPIIIRTWALMKYLLSQGKYRLYLNTHCIDQYLICAFYGICKIQQVQITFHQILDVYKDLLEPYSRFKELFPFSDIKKVWFEVDISPEPNNPEPPVGNVVDFYNNIFVPSLYDALFILHNLCQPDINYSSVAPKVESATIKKQNIINCEPPKEEMKSN
ncbi:hypothetical protein WA158_001049 [Blastocystis sp. Blastoise]